jgi:hypothetical protein
VSLLLQGDAAEGAKEELKTALANETWANVLDLLSRHTDVLHRWDPNNKGMEEKAYSLEDAESVSTSKIAKQKSTSTTYTENSQAEVGTDDTVPPYSGPLA